MPIYLNTKTGQKIKMSESAFEYLQNPYDWEVFKSNIEIPDVLKAIKEQPKKRGRNAKV